MSEQPYRVLFLCTGNSARSIMAEAIMNRVGPPRFKACSAGSQPKGEVSPHTLALLKSLDFAMGDLRSHWGLPDPALAEGSEAQISQALSDAYGTMRHHPNAESAGLPADRP